MNNAALPRSLATTKLQKISNFLEIKLVLDHYSISRRQSCTAKFARSDLMSVGVQVERCTGPSNN